jgi:hypothetical protein
MIQVRQNVFETNSSSTHSVSISYEGDLTDIPIPDDNGIVHVDTDEYGWEECEYNDLYSRLSYAATYALNYGSEENKELLTEVIKQYSGAKEVLYDHNNNPVYWKHGYIDHQSTDTVADIFESRESLVNFLFNPNSYFITDNDNH